MLILFDIDSTLIDTKWLIGERVFPAVAAAADVDGHSFHTLVDRYYQTLDDPTDFNPWDFIAFVSAETGASSEVLEKAYFDPKLFQAAIYDDVIPTLEALSENKAHNIGIYSQGIERYQRLKLKLGSVMQYFQNSEYQIIEERKSSLDVLDRIPKGAVLIDDHSRFLKPLAEKRSDLHLYWIYRDDPSDYEDIVPASVQHLQALTEILSELDTLQ